jgi:hypothetical protein
MTHTGMRPPPDPDDPLDIDPASKVQSVPDEEQVDSGTVEEDLEKSPEEKANATDGYAPADDEDVDTEELDELEATDG